MKASPTSKGYLTVTPAVDGRYKTRLLHRIVTEAFYGPQPEGLPEVRHLDGDQANNHPNNLDWGTQRQNRHDRSAHGREMGERHHSAKLNVEQVKFIRRQTTLSQRFLAKEFGVTQSTIQQAASGETWADDLKQDAPNMPRWASRITLEITDVRVQRLQDISEDDAEAEGVDLECPNRCSIGWLNDVPGGRECPAPHCGDAPSEHFQHIWDSINGKTHPWSSNPWLWCLTFKRVAA